MPREQKFNKQVGVFSAGPDPDVWSIRVKGAAGKIVRQVGTHKDAVNAYMDHEATKRLIAKGEDLMPYIDLMRGPTIAELVEKTAEFYKRRSATHESNFRRMAKPLLAHFGKRIAASLTTFELENWLLDEADENEWSPGTQNSQKFMLVAIFREGIKARLLRDNPANRILSAKDPNRRVRFFSEEEEQRIRQVILERAKRFPSDWEERLAQIDIAIHTGMRKSEQFGLTWNVVHLDDGTVFLERTKNGHSREVFLNQRAKAAFMFLKERQKRMGSPKNALVFPGGPSTLWFDNVLEEAGVTDAVWYTFRHTTASRLVMKGAPMPVVQMIMGHLTMRMTYRYAHLAAGYLLAAVEKIVPERKPFFGE